MLEKLGGNMESGEEGRSKPVCRQVELKKEGVFEYWGNGMLEEWGIGRNGGARRVGVVV